MVTTCLCHSGAAHYQKLNLMFLNVFCNPI